MFEVATNNAPANQLGRGVLHKINNSLSLNIYFLHSVR